MKNSAIKIIPYCLSILSSESILGLSTAWQLKRSPRAAKKSFPKKGNPGRLAKRDKRAKLLIGAILDQLLAVFLIGCINLKKLKLGR